MNFSDCYIYNAFRWASTPHKETKNSSREGNQREIKEGYHHIEPNSLVCDLSIYIWLIVFFSFPMTIKFKQRIQSMAIEGKDIIAAGNRAREKSIARLEAKEAAAKAAAKREEERVAELKKVRGEKWLPSIAREMKLQAQRWCMGVQMANYSGDDVLYECISSCSVQRIKVCFLAHKITLKILNLFLLHMIF